MALVEMLMPKMGESVMEGTILNWLKKVGDTILQDEPVLEVATDKVDTEIPATHAGILNQILVQKGEVVPVGKPIAIITTAESTEKEPLALETNPDTIANSDKTETLPNLIPAASETEIVIEKVQEGRFYSPLVLNIARQEAIPINELDKIRGTGKEGRLTKNDLLAYLNQRTTNGTNLASTNDPALADPNALQSTLSTDIPSQKVPIMASNIDTGKPAVSFSGKADIIEMDRMRKLIAQRMLDSLHIAAHVTSCVEADVTPIVRWRSQIIDQFKKREGIGMTYTPIFLMVIAQALKEMPMLNASVDGDKIIVKKDINLGLAVALPSGNLIVPVIKNADMLNLVGMTHQVNDLAKRARDNKLRPDELSNGTYTVSNIGSFGNMFGTPIIMQPQVGILSLGAIIKKPAVIETPDGDVIAIRSMMFLSHSYDHRVIDGALGGKFVKRVSDLLEKFDTTQKI